ncbi:transforming growth factor beta regulator 1-like [Plakobranchus ocellatus]|uniref:Transforming growth factor beta regulator 1-like n=1 Tax=Plakobranchus ocellatus TaxID=259542 RepID=A0AAV3Y5T9_9GAST|nr:transforming growth factor beta regulator 1-like [Plakobranchus ocellatus]
MESLPSEVLDAALKRSISTLPMPGQQQPALTSSSSPDSKHEQEEEKIVSVAHSDPVQSVASSVTKPNGSVQPTISNSSGRTKSALLNGQGGYAKKLRRIKLAIKNTIFVNGAICDEVLRTEEKLAKAKEERRFLLRKLLQHQSASDASLTAVKTEPQSVSKQGKDASASETGSKPTKAVKRKAPASSSSSTAAAPGLSSSLTTHPTSTLASADGTVASLPSSLVGVGISSLPGAGGTGSADSKKKLAQAAKEILGTANVKPKKGKGVSKRMIPPLMLDSLGRPVFPMVLGDITLHSIGEIVLDRPSFHSTESIFPAGYCITRVYGSLHKLDSSCLWTCKISENEEGPLFEIAAEDSSDIVFRATTPTECHALLLRAFAKTRNLQMSASETSGLDFFGLSHPVIQNLVQSCPGARKCPRYKWVKFEINKSETNDNVAVGTADATVGFEAYKAHLLSLGLKPTSRASNQMEQSTNLRSLLTKGHAGGIL